MATVCLVLFCRLLYIICAVVSVPLLGHQEIESTEVRNLSLVSSTEDVVRGTSTGQWLLQYQLASTDQRNVTGSDDVTSSKDIDLDLSSESHDLGYSGPFLLDDLWSEYDKDEKTKGIGQTNLENLATKSSKKTKNLVSVFVTSRKTEDTTNTSHIELTKQLTQSTRHKSGVRNNSLEVPMKRLPTAIIIGVKKAGTRALLEFLRIHPNVECTGPEPHFFDKHYHLGLEWYRDRMPVSYSDQMTIEKTPGYFVTKEAPGRIYAMNPNIKLVLVIRDPVTRAISDYCQAASKHPLGPFEDMALLDRSVGLVNTTWSAIKIGVYSKHLEHWLSLFPLSQLHIVDGQRLVDDPASELAQVEHFLGLPPYINKSHFHLRAFKGKFPCLIKHGKPHCLGEKTKGREHPKVEMSVLKRLQDFYRPFNAKFYQMVGHDFGWN